MGKYVARTLLLALGAAVVASFANRTIADPVKSQIGITPVELRCEYSEKPLAVEADKPRFSWQFTSQERDQRQSAYQILVATSDANLNVDKGDKWDSGRVESGRSVNVPYDGPKLNSAEACHWKVRVWDKAGKPSPWSKPAVFEMGLLAPNDWHGQWIGLGEPQGMKFVEGRVGKAIDLSGQIQSLRVEHYGGLKPRRQITITAWIKPRQATDEWQSIYRKEDGVARHLLAIGKTDGQFGLWSGVGVAGRYVELGAPLEPGEVADGKWHHVALVFDGEELICYFDGSRRNAREAKGNLEFRGRESAYIGSNGGLSEPFDGGIDELCVLPTALSSDTIKRLAAGESPEARPTGWWKFDGDLASAAYDPRDRATGFLAVPGKENAAVVVYNQDRLPSPLLRKEFKLDKEVKRARAYISGLGFSELYLNGRKVSDHVLDPCATEYEKHVQYVAHDVAKHLERGANAVGVMLGNGWFCEPRDQKYANSPALLLQLNIEFADGTATNIVSDSSWKAVAGPVIKNSIWRSEEYDARRDQAGWKVPGFDDRQWNAAVEKPKPVGALVSQMMPAMKVNQTIEPVKLTSPKAGAYVYDFGQMFGGWVRVKLKGPAGTRVAIRYSERIDEMTGLPDQKIHTSGSETDYYTLKGDPAGETYEPHFDFHPVRYVQLENYPGEPTIGDALGCVVYSAVDLSSEFSCSNKLLNQIHKNIRWTQTNNLFGYPLDCLHRELIAPIDPATVTGNLYPRPNMPLFWTKWLRDMKDAQRADGGIPDIAPDYFVYGGGGTDPAWGGNYPLLAWFVYEYYDDRRIIEEHYEPIKKWLDHCAANAKDKYFPPGHFGDHLVPGPEPGDEQFMSKETPAELVWTGYYYRGVYVAAKMAELLGKEAEAKQYASLAADIAKAYNDRWFDAKTNNYDKGSPTSNLFPLSLGIVPDGRAQQVADNASRMLVEKYGGHVHTGNIGTTSMIDTLADYGHGETMYGVATKTTFPGWGYMIVNGATTIWEAWGRYRYKSGHGGQESMIMWATLDEFFYNDLAGIRGPEYYGPTKFAPGFKQIEIKPYVLGDLTHAEASMPTVHGKIASSWKKDGDKLTLKVAIPVNCTGRVSVPKIGHNKVKIVESGKSIWGDEKYVSGASGIHSGRDEAEHVTFEVGSGDYEFVLSPAE
jgi:alpha-L-rhamnosidase